MASESVGAYKLTRLNEVFEQKLERLILTQTMHVLDTILINDIVVFSLLSFQPSTAQVLLDVRSADHHSQVEYEVLLAHSSSRGSYQLFGREVSVHEVLYFTVEQIFLLPLIVLLKPRVPTKLISIVFLETPHYSFHHYILPLG